MEIKSLVHRFVDECWDEWFAAQSEEKDVVLEAEPVAETSEKPQPRKLTSNERVVRSKSTGDKVFLLNEKDKTKRWITKPEVLEGLGFTLNDVEEIPDSELIGYKLSQAVYSADEAKK